MINYKIEGFKGVALEIQSLDDKMKRSEILKILRRQMQPVVDKMKQNAPNQRTKTINVRGTDYAPQELKNAISVKTSPLKNIQMFWLVQLMEKVNESLMVFMRGGLNTELERIQPIQLVKRILFRKLILKRVIRYTLKQVINLKSI